MGKQGLKGTQGNPFLYQELDSGRSSAIGLDSADNKLKISVANTPDNDPQGIDQLAVDPATDKVELPQETTPNGGVVQADPVGVLTSHPVSAFFASVQTPVNNVTGAGAVHTIVYDTERYDIGGDYDNTTGIFTAPDDGIYFFSTVVSMRNIDVTVVDGGLRMTIAGTGPNVGTHGLVSNNPGAVKASATNLWRNGDSLTVQLDAGDTVLITVQFSGAALNQVDLWTCLAGGPNDDCTFFCGFKLFSL